MIHMWWHEDPPQWVIEAHQAWAEQTIMEVKLWIGTEELPGVDEIASKAQVIPEDLNRHRSNVARWVILRNYGGIWVDCDTHPLRDPSDLNFNETFIASVVKNSVVPCVVGGPAEDRIWSIILANIEGRRGKSYQASGSGLLMDLNLKWGRIEPPGRFLSHDGRGVEVPLPSDGVRYCTHEWKTSAERLRNMRTNGG